MTLKGKTSTLLLATVVLALIFIPLARAQVTRVEIYGYVNKFQYSPGETGELKIWVVNEGDVDLIFQNITVVYPWSNYLPWEGNETRKEIGTVILVGGNTTLTFSFTVPNDGRAVTTGPVSFSVTVVTDKDVDSTSIPMSIANPPLNMAIQDMNNLVTLITVQTIIIIIAALIIAAAGFLSRIAAAVLPSRRRAGVTSSNKE